MYLKTAIAAGVALALTACSHSSVEAVNPIGSPDTVIVDANALAQSNPFAAPSQLQYQAPDFSIIKDEHFKPALEAGMTAHLREVNQIANNSGPATFDNTIVAMEKAGGLLDRVSRVFYNLTSSNSNDTIRAVQTEMAPRMSAHSDDIYLNAKLFDRVNSLYQSKDSLNLDAESERLLEVYYKRFVRSGAKLNAEEKQKIRELNGEEAKLTNAFGQNLLKLAKERAVVVDTAEELDGLTQGQIDAAAKRAEAAGHKGKYQLRLVNTTRQDIMANINDRELRQRIWEASAYRGLDGDNETKTLVSKLSKLRAEKAKLLGYESWANYQLETAMAKEPQAVRDMFASMVPSVVKNTKKEAAKIEAMIKAEGNDHPLQPWDWAYYAEKVRQAEFALDENEVKQYFEFNSVLKDGVFFTMNKLFGIEFKPRPDLPVYHEDVEAYEIFDKDGQSMAIFYADYFARDGKRGGAWMSSFVGQSKLENSKPVIVNVMNIPKAPNGEPTLVSYDNVTTMFHEMGHGLHGAFSDVNFPSLAGTSVSRDFVEFPSTFMEDWAHHPDVLPNYAKHYKTGADIPAELLEKIIKSRSFNQGFDTLEYMSAALLDMEWHSLTADTPMVTDVAEFEAAALRKHGVDLPAIPPRYKSTFFAHVFPGGYSASYYAYMWSEILAADAYAYVQETGGLTRENGEKFRKHILEVGNTKPPMEAYEGYRGKAPTTDALLERRGIK
ncbi:M3 family metallopeptidase [Paraferrimonas sedimenticola]|uniref:Dipeptidyl carboxypeptidase II n=1 Tax=Paraferrimonas sedimenticola TaxID=375674 RepID=A0AA37VUC8_9GAMM|nr:M3 family metallopeptidase [Paraferrimonas sedimenticola]GLP95799.1 dipeptidyl carboxypeptidase II [Paraferrimonas sedimenticola]